MDQLYRGVETSLLVLSLALVLAVAALPTFPLHGPMHGPMEVSLPLISVAHDAAP